VDDCLCIHHDADASSLHEIDNYFSMKKPGSTGDPDIYLGAKLHKVTMQNGVQCWAQPSSKYLVQASIWNIRFT
jgi:hypothetical protein